MVEKTSFRYQEGVNSKVVDRMMTKKALLPSDDRTYAMDRTSESENVEETECDGNERLFRKICRLLICKCFVCEKTDFVMDS